jgi:serine/threonine protein kinase
VLQELRPGDPRVIGPYRLIGQLGGGGMGRVFLGRSAGGRPVAVKVIRSELASDPDFRGRFRREVAAARRVNGLFTAMVVDADVDAEEPWLATAYVPGPSLSEAVHDHGPLPARSVLALTAGLAESLAAIHAAGVVHRDLKPPNVLLAEDGPRVIDFGISRAAEATSMTRAGFVIGSPGFMSPEQAEGGEIGPASDIFSLGAVIVFAATGESPFGSGMTAALVYRVVHAAPRLDGVPDAIRPLIEQCLAKDPGQRPAVSDLMVEADAFESTAGWLPEPIMRSFPERPAPAVAQPPPPATEPSPLPVVAAESGEPTDASYPITNRSPLVAPEPEAVAPEPETGSSVHDAMTPDPDTGPSDLDAMTPDTDTGPSELDAMTPEPDAGPSGAEADTVPVAGVPLAAGSLRRRRFHSRRSVVLVSAAAVILIASVSSALALSGPGHASASPPHPTSAAVIPSPAAQSLQPTTPAPSPSAATSSTRSRPRRTRRPSPHPTTAAPTTQAPTQEPSTTAPTPKHTPTPKPTPKHTSTPAPLTVSVSGGSELSCGEIGSVKSSAGASVSYAFANNSSGDVQIAMIDASGAVVPQATIEPGGVSGASASVGSYWVVENSGGGCLAVVEVEGGGQATVR